MGSAPRQGSRGVGQCPSCCSGEESLSAVPWHCARESWSAVDEGREGGDDEPWRARYRASLLVVPQLTGRRGQLCLCVWGALGEVECRSFSYRSSVSGQWSVVNGGLRSHASHCLHRSSSHRTSPSRSLDVGTGELVLVLRASRLVSPTGVKPPTPIRFCSLGSLHDQDPAALPTSSIYIHAASPPHHRISAPYTAPIIPLLSLHRCTAAPLHRLSLLVPNAHLARRRLPIPSPSP